MLAGQIAAGPLASAQTASSKTITYNIPAGNLSSALTQWAQASGMKFLAASGVLQGRTTAGLSGTYEPHQALDALLANSGLTHSTNGSTVTISAPGDNAGATIDGAIALDTIDVSGGGSSAAAGADAPYETAGSTSYISAEQIQRLPGSTAGDMFKGTAGVISGMNRNGASVDVNIRGMQGMNRVATTVDGSEQSTSTWRGYAGVDNRTYIDPDLVSGATITKGPSEGGTAGAIGGSVAIETLSVSDILKPGDSYGVRIKGSVADNSIAPEIGRSQFRTEPDSIFDFTSGSRSVAAAASTEHVDTVVALVKRKSGNYFAGTNGALTVNGFTGEQALSDAKYGDEVFNTSENSTSFLFKSTVRPSDGHELKLGYMRYENTFGEITPTLVYAGNGGRQIILSGVLIDQVTARYSWNPADNDLINFKANAWASNLEEDSVYSIYTDSFHRYTQTKNFGFDLSNASTFDLASMPLTLRYGASLKREDASPREWQQSQTLGALYPVDGTRRIGSVFLNGKLEPTKWLAVDAGIEYLNYDVDYRGTEAWGYTRDANYPRYTGYAGDGVSPSASVTVTPLDGWQLFAKYSTGVRPPSLRETSYSNSALIFNPDLDAERAENWEFGTNLLKRDFFLDGDTARLKLAYFDNTTHDYIGRKSENYVLSLFNYDKVEMKGVELSGGYDAKKAFVDFAFNYYTDFKSCPKPGTCVDYTLQSDYLANQIPPEFTASITAGVRLFDGDLTLGGRYTYASARLAPLVPDPTYFFMTTEWAAYSLVDAFAQWKINDSVTLDLAAENLLDRYYVDPLNNSDVPSPGRTLRATLTAKLGTDEPPPTIWPFDRRNYTPQLAGALVNWSGFHAGMHIGYGIGSITGVTTDAAGTSGGIPATESADQDPANILGGVQGGYSYQLANGIVLGVEGDFAWTRMNDYSDVVATESAGFTERNQLEARIDYKFDWLATLRGRLGYAFDRFQVYGTGGLAFLKETERRRQFKSTAALATQTETDSFFSETDSAVRQGWTLGAGGEYAISDSWSLKGEYLYSNFAVESFLFSGARAGVTQTYSYRCTPWPSCFRTGGQPAYITVPGTSDTVNGRKASNDVDLHTVKMGLNYRF